MKFSVAEAIARKTKGLKHCDKLLKSIEKKGNIEIPLSGTGVSLPVAKGDAIHTLLQSIRFGLAHEINTIEIANNGVSSKRYAPAPVGAYQPTATCTECGQSFIKHHATQKYCCEDCAASARRKYQRGYAKAHRKTERS